MVTPLRFCGSQSGCAEAVKDYRHEYRPLRPWCNADGGEVAVMRAMTVVPGRKGTAGVETLDEPPVAQGELLVSGRLVGVCGTDR